MAILVSDKRDFNTEDIIGDKDERFILIKMSMYQ